MLPEALRGPAVPPRGTLPGYLHEQISIHAPESSAKAPAGTQQGLCQGTHPAQGLPHTLCAPLAGCSWHCPSRDQSHAGPCIPAGSLAAVPQLCKAEALPDPELFPPLTQLCLSLSSPTTAEQLSTVPPAPHLQQTPLQIRGTASPGMLRALPLVLHPPPARLQPRSSCVQWPGKKWKPWKELNPPG